MNINILHYQFEDISIGIPTHHNKYEIIRNAFKYDISKCAYKFLKYKIEQNELYFTVDGIDCHSYINNNTDKKHYAVLVGNLIKIERNIYVEYLHSAISFLEGLARKSKLYESNLKIYKSYVDEIITSKKMVIDSAPNKYGYDVKCEKINVFVKKLETLKKQLYVTNQELIINHNFKNESNLITDLNEININTASEKAAISEFEYLSNQILSGKYPISKLIELNPNNILEIKIGTAESKVQYSKFMSYEYDVEYYHKIFREIGKYILMSKDKNVTAF